MDNFNALSKSAILTKLALDGYFIDLLTLNSFIKDWQIEAIYENEFGIEFFDNNSYLTILDKLKDKYNKTKSGIEERKPATVKNDDDFKDLCSEKKSVNSSENLAKEIVSEYNNSENTSKEADPTISKLDSEHSEIESNAPTLGRSDVVNADKSDENIDNIDLSANSKDNASEAISLEELVNKSEKEIIKEDSPIDLPIDKQKIQATEKLDKTHKDIEYITEENVAQKVESVEVIHYENTILPIAMRNLKPGPVSPNSNINVDHSYNEAIEASYVQSEETIHIIDENSLDNFEEESFSADEIEKANNLINNAIPKKLPESITETYFDTNAANKQQINDSSGESIQKTESADKINKEARPDELDLVQLAQSFAQNFTGKETGDVPPADLEQIFTESYTEPFSELQDYVQDKPEEYKSLQEDLPSDIIVPEVPTEATHSDSALVSHSKSDLSAEDVRSIIREEIARQTASIVPVPQNNENVKEILREIVKQTADVVPQNAFKLDISQGTLDMIAKTIAKKIAIKLNSYYKLNSSKQNAKLQLFRTRTIELKEKNQMLADENRKLKARLLESNSELNSYKRTIFGLYKFEGRHRR